MPCTPLPTGSQKDECETRAIEDCTKPVGLVHGMERNNGVWGTLEQASCQPAPLERRLRVLCCVTLADRSSCAHFTDVGRGCESCQPRSRSQPCSRSQRSSLWLATSWGESCNVGLCVSLGQSRWSCALPALANRISPSHTSRLKVQPRSTSLPGFHAPVGPEPSLHRTCSKPLGAGARSLASKLFTLGDELFLGAGQGLWGWSQGNHHSLAKGRLEVARGI